MSESSAYKSFRDAIAMPGDRIDRVENLCVKGMFDLNCCIDGKEFWIEMKYAKEPVRASTKLLGDRGLSQDQKNWAMMQLQAGGKAFVLISTNKRRILLNATHADSINNLSAKELCDIAIVWSSLPQVRANWDLFRERMLETVR